MSNYQTEMTDSEYYSSDDDEDFYDFYQEDENFYEPETISRTKYNIVLCELDNVTINKYRPLRKVSYGALFITHYRFKTLDMDIINHMISLYPKLRLEISECFYVEQICTSILKTFWLKIIQKRWKKRLQERKRFIFKLTNSSILQSREINAKWTNQSLQFPGLRGILSDWMNYSLSRTSS